MNEKVEIKTGTKIDKEELLKTDIRHLAVMITSPPAAAAVEGQYRYNAYTRCPWCGHIGYTYRTGKRLLRNGDMWGVRPTVHRLIPTP